MVKFHLLYYSFVRVSKIYSDDCAVGNKFEVAQIACLPTFIESYDTITIIQLGTIKNIYSIHFIHI